MADKFVDIKPGTGLLRERTPISVSAGAADAGKLFALDPNGKIDPSLEYGTSVKSYPVSEAVALGAAINVWNDGGVSKVRNAIASATPIKCTGIALTAQAVVGQQVKIVLDDEVLAGYAGLTPDAEYFLSDTVPGGITATPPTGAGTILQRIGRADQATNLLIDISDPIERG